MSPSELVKGAAYQGTQHKRRSPITYTGRTGTQMGYPVWQFETEEKYYDLFENELADLVQIPVGQDKPQPAAAP